MGPEPYLHKNDHEHRRRRPDRGEGEITGANTKTAAVEMALKDLASRRKPGKALSELAEIPGDELAAGDDFTACALQTGIQCSRRRPTSAACPG